MKKISFFLVVTLSLIALSACNKTGNTAISVNIPDHIKIGVIGPFTGNMGSVGLDVKAGVALYFKENPIIQNKTVEVIYEDGKCNGQDSANAAQKLINIDKVQAIIGGMCSSETLAAAPIAEANKVVMVSPTSSSPAVTTAGDYIFRNYPSDFEVAKTMVNIALKNHQKVALLSEQSDYAQGFRNAIKIHFVDAGKTDQLVMDEAYPADNTDFRTLLTKVQKSQADGVITIVQAPVTAGFIAKQAKEIGLKLQFYGGDTVPGPDFFSTGKEATEGFKVVMVAEDPNRAGYADVIEQGGPAQSSEVFIAFGYDAANLVAKAIVEAGYNGTAIKDYWYNMGVFKGVASDVNFDKNGDNKVAARVKVARNGKFVFED